MNNYYSNSESYKLKNKISFHLTKYIWYLVSIIVAGIISFVIVKNSPTSYITKSKILINNKYQHLPEIDILPDLASNIIATLNNSTVDDQVDIFSSRDLINESLKLNTNYVRLTSTQLSDTILKIKNNLQIITSNNKKSYIIDVLYHDLDPKNGESIVNNLIITYQNRHKRILDSLNKTNLDFIEKRLSEQKIKLKNLESTIADIRYNKKIPVAFDSDNFYWENISKNNQIISDLKIKKTNLEKLLQNLSNHDPKTLFIFNKNLIDNKLTQSYFDEYIEIIKNKEDNKKLEPRSIFKNVETTAYETEHLQKLLEVVKKEIINNDTLLDEYTAIKNDNSNQFLTTINSENYLSEYLRDKKTTEEVYLYLSKKFEEVGVIGSKITPAIYVIEHPYSTISRNKLSSLYVVLISLSIAVIVPYASLEIYRKLITKVNNLIDIKRIYDGPILGTVAKYNDPLYNARDKALLNEEIRKIKLNLDFLLTNKSPKQGSVIYVTSTIPNEGKTFVAVHLSKILALKETGKKVLLIGGDIRNPQISDYFENNEQLNNNLGLTNFLKEYYPELKKSNQNILNKYIIKNIKNYNFHHMPAGANAPNPSELLSNKNFERLINLCKESYDYVIVDTSPIEPVVDTSIISKYADCTIYIVRNNYLETSKLELLREAYEGNKLKNIGVLLNYTKNENKYYNYYYS